ncbi:hypothetical protein BD408DRAFT_441219 [Parasitella parasitica]|nr:hypothetical protein BD408DRAFT_441219 [Parasitella parasitica]
MDKTSVNYDFFPTVRSQSFTDLMPPPSISFTNNFWDSLVQQQQEQLDSTNSPQLIGNLSQDLYHEGNSAAALLAVNTPRLGISSFAAAPMFDSSYHPNMPFHLQHSVIKDDVFLAQPSVFYTEIEDNVSLSSRSSLSSSQHGGEKLPRSPRLSPVTSPTKFLYNHEPLFEGSIIGTDETTMLGNHGQGRNCEDSSSAMLNQPVCRLSAREDIHWSKLLDVFCDGDDNDDHMSLSSLSSESDMEAYVTSQHPASNSSKKRNRSTQDQSRKTPKAAHRQKRGRKKRATTPTVATATITKKILKKKILSDPQDVGLLQQSVIAKTQHDVVEQNKETHSVDQLLEAVASDEERESRTMFQQLTDSNIDWCRYCGTRKGVSWRPGPWGKRTLCNKHGCDYKGYGLATRVPRLDLSMFANERLEDRVLPVIQEFCTVCQFPEQTDKEKAPSNRLICCQGVCSRAYHQQCHKSLNTVNQAVDSIYWYCSESCKDNRKLKKAAGKVPRKQMLLMHLPPKSKKKITT